MASIKVKGILSYPHLFTARSVQPGDDPKFSTSVLVRKDDPQMTAILQVLETEKANGWPNGFPANGKTFIRDCAVQFPEDPRLANYWAISGNAAADSRPHVVDAHLNPIMDQSQVYAGVIAWVQFNTFVYNMPVNKGVGAGLNGVMVTGVEGELGRLDGKPTVEAMFGDVAGDATATTAPAAAPAAPVPAAPTAAPAPVPSAPVAAPAPAPAPAAPQFVMTAAANGLTREQYHAAGWTDEQLVQNGMMIAPSFA